MPTWPGHKYTGPFNSLDSGEPTGGQTDIASQKHDKAYAKFDGNPYTTYLPADDDWVKEAANDIPGIIGKGFFGIKKIMAPAGKKYRGTIYDTPRKEKIANSLVQDDMASEPMMGGIGGGGDSSPPAAVSTGNKRNAPSEGDEVSTISSGVGAGGYIPRNDTGHIYTKTFNMGMTRGFFFTSTDNSYTITETSDGPDSYGGGTNENGLIETPWKIVPTSDLGLYATPLDFQQAMSLGAFEVRFKKAQCKIHDMMLSTDIANSQTYNSGVDKPSIYAFRDEGGYYQNSSSDSNSTRVATPNYNPNLRLLRQEEQGNAFPFSEYIEMNTLKYWSPHGPNELGNNEAERQYNLLTREVPQPEHLGGIEIHKPGDDILWNCNIPDQWIGLLDAGGNFDLTGQKQGDKVGTVAGRFQPPRTEYTMSSHWTSPFLEIDGIQTTPIRQQLVKAGMTSAQHNFKAPNGLYLRMPTISTFNGTAVQQKLYFLIDYHLEIEVKYAKLPMYRTLSTAGFQEYGFPKIGGGSSYTDSSDRNRLRRITGGAYGRKFHKYNTELVDEDFTQVPY